jgi:hypothetical protein
VNTYYSTKCKIFVSLAFLSALIYPYKIILIIAAMFEAHFPKLSLGSTNTTVDTEQAEKDHASYADNAYRNANRPRSKLFEFVADYIAQPLIRTLFSPATSSSAGSESTVGSGTSHSSPVESELPLEENLHLASS